MSETENDEYKAFHELIADALPDALHDVEMSPADVLATVLWDHGYRPDRPDLQQIRDRGLWDGIYVPASSGKRRGVPVADQGTEREAAYWRGIRAGETIAGRIIDVQIDALFGIEDTAAIRGASDD